MTRILDGLAPRMVLPGLTLKVVEGPDLGHELALEGGEALVGSAPDNQLVLSDPAVSRHHVRVRLREEGALVEDLGSTNGTRLEGLEVHAAPLRPGQQVTIGQTTLLAAASGEEVVLPLSRRTRFGGLLGASVAMRRVFHVLERVAPAEATILLEGETGTGKEVAAQAIHDASGRSEGPFIAIDCGAISANLIESELFGHVRGAFTGAHRAREGAFEAASGGTLFLDEIGELPLDLQPKLLRALEMRQVVRVGESEPRPVDVRIIAATNRNLRAEADAGRFREDLYFRLAVVRVELPPLRDRPEDLPMLIEHFVGRLQGPTASVPVELVRRLSGRSWQGNVRELRNAVERELILAEPIAPDLGDVEALEQGTSPLLASLLALPLQEAREAWLTYFMRVYLQHALDRSDGNVTHAARQLQLHRRQLQRYLSRYGVRDDD